MADPKILPHGGLEELAEGVWRVRGTLSFPLYRNMIVVRLPGGDLLLHSVVAMDDAGLAALKRLGRPAYSIVPHAHHQMDAPFFQERFPDMKALAPAAEAPKMGNRFRLDGTVEAVLPALGITCHPVPGMRVGESVFEMPLASGGRLLIVNDLFAGENQSPPGLMPRIMSAITGAPGRRFGMARIVRLMQVKDRRAVARFVAGLAAIPDIRLITVSHGDPERADPAGALRRVARSLDPAAA